MTRLHKAMAVPTHRNTSFPNWWEMLNAEMAKRGLPEVLFGDARGAYEMGEAPSTAAANFQACA